MQENKDIEGITVSGNEIKISQYADDTTMILDASKTSFTSALLDLELFGEISGLLLNSNLAVRRFYLGGQRCKNLMPISLTNLVLICQGMKNSFPLHNGANKSSLCVTL